MVLAGIQIDTMNARRLRTDGVGKSVISGGGNHKHNIVRSDVENKLVFTRIFPGECVNVVRELSMFLALGVVRDSP